MGRKTCESLPNKHLSDRVNIVMTRSVDYKNAKAHIVNSFDKALKCAEEKKVDKNEGK